MPLRNAYVQDRIAKRMASRGEPMVLRRVTMVPGPEPYKNPLDVSDDVTVFAANAIGGQDYFNLSGSTVGGRLQVGDQIVCAGPPQTTWTVVSMPADVLTNADGVPQVSGGGAPVFGVPPVYFADSVAWDNVLPVVPVVFANGPVMTQLTLVLDVLAGTLTLAGGGFAAAAVNDTDVVQITGATAPNAAINGADLTVTATSDTMLTVTGLPGGLAGGTLAVVTLTVTGGTDTDITETVGESVSFVFAADEDVFGYPLSYYQMTQLGWIEVDGIGYSIAAQGIDPPKINDLIVLTSRGGEKRSIVQTSQRYMNGVEFLYPVQAR